MPWAWYEPEPIEAKTNRVKKFKDDFDSGVDNLLGVFNHSETELIGSTGLHARIEGNAREIGYWINVNHLKNGYATEIVAVLTCIGFEAENLDRIEIHCDVKNKLSALIPEKYGYTLKETRIANAKDVYGGDRDTMIWVMTARDYKLKATSNVSLKAFDKEGNEILVK